MRKSSMLLGLRRPLLSQQPPPAVSPSNDQLYEMVCGWTNVTVNDTTWHGSRCAGGNNAVVILW
jgi:hypothetical protein